MHIKNFCLLIITLLFYPVAQPYKNYMLTYLAELQEKRDCLCFE